VALGGNTPAIKSTNASQEYGFGTKLGISSIRIGDAIVPTDKNGQILLHYTDIVPGRYIPAWKAMSPDFDPALVEGKILFIGTSASGLRDLRPTPLRSEMPGVEAHVQAVEQMILGHYLERPDFADGIEWVFVFITGIVLIGLLGTAGALASATFGAIAIVGSFAVSWLAYTKWLWLFDPVTPSMGAFAVYLSGSLLGYLRTEGEKRRVRGQFSQYMSPELVDQLAKEPDRLKLGGETRNMTILFCDLRGFTTISEQFKTDPQGLTVLINRFLTPMTAIIRSQKGTIDKYIGDCIMAFWNAPLDDPDHAINACRTVLQMHERMVSLNDELEADAKAAGRKHVPLAIGIGLNSGDVVAGNMGSEQRFDYTVLGDAVNLSSRLEGQSKTYGVGTVIGEVTRELAPAFAHLELDLIAVKGKKEAVRIFTVFGDPALAATEAFQRLSEEHDRMIAAYRAQQWAEAKALLGKLRAMEPKLNGLYDLYEERIMYFEENPPGAEWDGVFVATSK
jgi:adenylate cyclase